MEHVRHVTDDLRKSMINQPNGYRCQKGAGYFIKICLDEWIILTNASLHFDMLAYL
jgi:hypothetical protein